MLVRFSTIVIILSSIVVQNSTAQGYYFGPRGGLAIAFQNWNNIQRDPLLAFQGDLFLETNDEENKGSLFAMLGYHTRGSSIRVANFLSGANFQQGIKFNNAVLTIGAKKKIDLSEKFVPYYQVGLRAEYTVSNNLDELSPLQSTYYPFAEFVNNFNYGINLGGGFEYVIDELITSFIDFNIAPDISFQYRQPAIQNVISPYNGQPTSIPARDIRNFNIEISIGFKFLRKVIYVD